MRTLVATVLTICLLLSAGLIDEVEAGHRFGGGLHYLRNLGDIKDVPEWDSNALGFMGSYQYSAGLLKIEGDLEFIPDYGGSNKTLYQPQGWLLLGGLIYLGGGIGIGYIDGDWMDEPFYALRLGLNLGLGGLNLDGFATYRFQNSKVFEELDNSDLNSITFGALLLFGD